MNEIQLKAKAKQIEDMSLNEIEELKKEISQSNLTGKPKYFLYEEIDRRELELSKQEDIGILVEVSEFKYGDMV